MRDGVARLAAPGAAARPIRNDMRPDLESVDIALDELRPPKHKVRKSDPAHAAEVAASISEFGFSCPVLVGKTNIVLDGQIRVEAAKLLGLSHVPCVRVKHLSDAAERALSLAARRLGEKGQWDLDELKVEFDELILGDAAIEIAFPDYEIDQILMGEERSSVEQGPLAPKPGALAVARPGDVFQLGQHRVICGDATDRTVLTRLMEGDAEARMVLTDVPYNVKIHGNVTGGDHREFAMASGEMSDAQFGDFNSAAIAAVLPYVCDGGLLTTFIDWKGYPIVHCAAMKAGLAPLNMAVWNKTNAGMGSLYRSKYELFAIFKKGGAPHVNNVKLGKNGRSRTNVWDYAGASSLGSDARRGLKEHPTVKPTVMLVDALLDVTNRGDIVIDPFLGSGSTLIAAHQCGRICRGVEIDPLYVDVIIRRFEEVTGKSAVLIATGETFAELSARRAKNGEPPTHDALRSAAADPMPENNLEVVTAGDGASDMPADDVGLDFDQVLRHMASMKTGQRATEDRAGLAISEEVAAIDDVADAEAMDEYEFDALLADEGAEAVPFDIEEKVKAPAEVANADASGVEAPDTGAVDVFGASLITGAGGPADELTGARLVDLQPDGVAASAGLEEGDLIVSVANEKVTHPREVLAQIAKARAAGQEVLSLEVYAKGKFWDAEFAL